MRCGRLVVSCWGFRESVEAQMAQVLLPGKVKPNVYPEKMQIAR